MTSFLSGRSLFSRIFIHGLFVLVASGVTFAAVGEWLVRPEMERRSFVLARWAAPQFCKRLLGDTSVALLPHVAATVYDTRGSMLGSSVQPPVPPLSPERVATLRTTGGMVVPDPPAIHAFWCKGAIDGAYVRMGPPDVPMSRMLLVAFSLVVLIVGLGSIPFARSIARPLATLVGVTQAFGRGELGARIALPRNDEVGQLARAFNHMASRLQRVILAEQELLANVSHELRTPLARMRVVFETVEENPRHAEAMLQEIGRDLADLEHLVETVTETMRISLAASGVSANRLQARLEETDLVACILSAERRFRAMHPERKVSLDIAPAPLLAVVDARLIQRLLDNLLDNARKYSESTTSILVRARVDDADKAGIAIEVTDYGIGIDEADVPHVFDPFFRSERGRSYGPPGSGLGLALVKRIVDVHAGEIGISSKVGVGTNVRVSLPALDDCDVAG